MFKLLLIALVSIPLFAALYPEPYQETATPLFKARVSYDTLLYHDTLREKVYPYIVHSDAVLGKYLPLNLDSDPSDKEAYLKALRSLQQEYAQLNIFLHRQLNNAIEQNNYPLFLAIIRTKNEENFKDPYLREKIYTYYHAHRDQEQSCYLDTRIKMEWNAIAPYFPKKELLDYRQLGDAGYREVFLVTTKESPYGAKTASFFKMNKVKYKAYTLQSEEGSALFKKFKGNRIPLVIINNRVVQGYNEFEMDRLLRR